MELLQLRYFFESAKNENFSKTAALFMVPTTSVSSAIKRLEKELGCPLFDRSANRIRLNTNGQLFQQALCSVFHDLDTAVEALSVHSEDSREIRILVRGMRRSITDLITRYSKNYPRTKFRISFDCDGDDYDCYDIIIDDEKDIYSDYERIELFHMPLSLKCACTDPLCGQALTLEQFCGYPFVSLDAKSNMQKILTKACSRVGFTPDISVLCNDIECYEKFISAGLGIGIGRKNENTANISDLNVINFNEHYTVYAYYLQKEFYGKVKSFVEFLKEQV